jgi:hypothetical protein
MTDNLSLSMTLRLRGNANACNRSAEQNRRALQQSRATETPAHTLPVHAPGQDRDEAEVLPGIATAQTPAAETNPSPQAATVQAPVQPPAPATPTTAQQRQRQATWAAAMAEAAAKLTAGLPNLPPAERKEMSIRAAAMASSAQKLLSGKVAPQLRPGDLAAMMRPNPS